MTAGRRKDDMTTYGRTMTDETRIRRLVADFATAFSAKDVEAIMGFYAPDFVSYDLAPPLLNRRAEVARDLAEWFRTWDGPIGFEIHDLVVVAGDGVAFSRSLNRLTGRRTSGDATDVWVRATVCYRKTGGDWTVAHEHTSVPFYMDGSFRAAVDLQP